jgi:hypothetical protein
MFFCLQVFDWIQTLLSTQAENGGCSKEADLVFVHFGTATATLLAASNSNLQDDIWCQICKIASAWDKVFSLTHFHFLYYLLAKKDGLAVQKRRQKSKSVKFNFNTEDDSIEDDFKVIDIQGNDKAEQLIQMTVRKCLDQIILDHKAENLRFATLIFESFNLKIKDENLLQRLIDPQVLAKSPDFAKHVKLCVAMLNRVDNSEAKKVFYGVITTQIDNTDWVSAFIGGLLQGIL